MSTKKLIGICVFKMLSCADMAIVQTFFPAVFAQRKMSSIYMGILMAMIVPGYIVSLSYLLPRVKTIGYLTLIRISLISMILANFTYAISIQIPNDIAFMVLICLARFAWGSGYCSICTINTSALGAIYKGMELKRMNIVNTLAYGFGMMLLGSGVAILVFYAGGSSAPFYTIPIYSIILLIFSSKIPGIVEVEEKEDQSQVVITWANYWSFFREFYISGTLFFFLMVQTNRRFVLSAIGVHILRIGYGVDITSYQIDATQAGFILSLVANYFIARNEKATKFNFYLNAAMMAASFFLLGPDTFLGMPRSLVPIFIGMTFAGWSYGILRPFFYPMLYSAANEKNLENASIVSSQLTFTTAMVSEIIGSLATMLTRYAHYSTISSVMGLIFIFSFFVYMLGKYVDKILMAKKQIATEES